MTANTTRINAVRRCIEAGDSYSEAAAKLGLTRSAVAGICKRNNIRGTRGPSLPQPIIWNDEWFPSVTAAMRHSGYGRERIKAEATRA